VSNFATNEILESPENPREESVGVLGKVLNLLDYLAIQPSQPNEASPKLSPSEHTASVSRVLDSILHFIRGYCKILGSSAQNIDEDLRKKEMLRIRELQQIFPGFSCLEQAYNVLEGKEPVLVSGHNYEFEYYTKVELSSVRHTNRALLAYHHLFNPPLLDVLGRFFVFQQSFLGSEYSSSAPIDTAMISSIRAILSQYYQSTVELLSSSELDGHQLIAVANEMSKNLRNKITEAINHVEKAKRKRLVVASSMPYKTKERFARLILESALYHAKQLPNSFDPNKDIESILKSMEAKVFSWLDSLTRVYFTLGDLVEQVFENNRWARSVEEKCVEKEATEFIDKDTMQMAKYIWINNAMSHLLKGITHFDVPPDSLGKVIRDYLVAYGSSTMWGEIWPTTLKLFPRDEEIGEIDPYRKGIKKILKRRFLEMVLNKMGEIGSLKARVRFFDFALKYQDLTEKGLEQLKGIIESGATYIPLHRLHPYSLISKEGELGVEAYKPSAAFFLETEILKQVEEQKPVSEEMLKGLQSQLQIPSGKESETLQSILERHQLVEMIGVNRTIELINRIMRELRQMDFEKYPPYALEPPEGYTTERFQAIVSNPVAEFYERRVGVYSTNPVFMVELVFSNQEKLSFVLKLKKPKSEEDDTHFREMENAFYFNIDIWHFLKNCRHLVPLCAGDDLVARDGISYNWNLWSLIPGECAYHKIVKMKRHEVGGFAPEEKRDYFATAIDQLALIHQLSDVWKGLSKEPLKEGYYIIRLKRLLFERLQNLLGLSVPKELQEQILSQYESVDRVLREASKEGVYYKDASPRNDIISPDGLVTPVDFESDRRGCYLIDLISKLECGWDFDNDEQAFNEARDYLTPVEKENLIDRYLLSRKLISLLEILNSYDNWAMRAYIPKGLDEVLERSKGSKAIPIEKEIARIAELLERRDIQTPGIYRNSHRFLQFVDPAEYETTHRLFHIARLHRHLEYAGYSIRDIAEAARRGNLGDVDMHARCVAYHAREAFIALDYMINHIWLLELTRLKEPLVELHKTLGMLVNDYLSIQNIREHAYQTIQKGSTPSPFLIQPNQQEAQGSAQS